MSVPDDLQYTAEHEWVRLEGDIATVGITQYAADSLGDVVYVELPAVGAALAAGAIVGEVESTKSVGELYAPLAGEVVEANQGVVDAPETINADPYGEGWLVKLRVSEPPALMTADDYRTLISA
ncbi:glycine cleavage system protein GcvH [Chryseoglobus sp. 28M-23]|uniref:glycine cleavage system protein GcvH n=1 Tax=Chryseoglobus sp. 28M-23 TaxID=2772253 RepID=UPI0017462098|nr:glycine cleavage system protein GcvH [Chryseoglobus sp. 28M-23]MBU1250763.1 glycine cleavage system protein GcvH [Actinomycetota bacterium]MBU1607962.1 glycine cleavage system protein GcvH [Actinomycetota bacterium]MBU2316138.1 glycine cleavage system protein GcvH [Actinomycetota bacterium]MBU2386190.1 glycine cleavage system protein GcvH [Actinomycetota bacterium]QOD94262.1 glycine cleavage system protein GcvH [Chryseoglobus sp. 28M-23]